MNKITKNVMPVPLQKNNHQVWIVPKREQYLEDYLKRDETPENDALPQNAHRHDLLLIYISSPKSQILFICQVVELLNDKNDESWAKTKLLCKLDHPLTREELKSHKVLKNAGFVKANFVKSQRVTPYWRDLYNLIIKSDSKVKGILREYAPERMKDVL
jgi:hypothetical protein